ARPAAVARGGAGGGAGDGPPGAAAARARAGPARRGPAADRRDALLPPPRGRGGVRTGYLGPPGTFAEEALLALGTATEAVPFPTVVDCFRAVREGEVPAALVPLENSIEGSVNQTLDQLAAARDELKIRAEVVHPVSHHLIARRPIEP